VEEKIFFENGNVKVTNARFVVGDQTYAMAAVNSVNVSSVDVTPSNTMPGILIAVGAIWFISALAGGGEFSSFIWAVAITAVGFYWFRSIKKTFEYRIVLTTSSGETPALRSTNVQDIRPVEKALHDAIVFRG
jgi:hypothetical protein